jgi:site-specific recombinase XerD
MQLVRGLELDELTTLLKAAEDEDRSPLLAVPIDDTKRTRDRVARLAATGKRPSAIAEELGLAKSTVTFHLRKLGAANAAPYAGRRAIVEMLARSGVRVSELCDIQLRDVRLHDRDGARFRIPDAKTEAGIREVQLTPDLVDVLTQHLRRLRAAGYPTGPDAYLVPSLRGNRITRQRVGKVLKEAAMLATGRLEQQGRPPLPQTSPHTLRRTYISIALIANNFDVKWVMSQVGHADSSMTMDVYAQLEQRVNRQHGTAFDARLREARGHEEDREKATKRPRDPTELEIGSLREAVQAKKKPAHAAFQTWRDPDSNRGHHDFQSWMAISLTAAKTLQIFGFSRPTTTGSMSANCVPFAWIWALECASVPNRRGPVAGRFGRDRRVPVSAGSGKGARH